MVNICLCGSHTVSNATYSTPPLWCGSSCKWCFDLCGCIPIQLICENRLMAPVCRFLYLSVYARLCCANRQSLNPGGWQMWVFISDWLCIVVTRQVWFCFTEWRRTSVWRAVWPLDGAGLLWWWWAKRSWGTLLLVLMASLWESHIALMHLISQNVPWGPIWVQRVNVKVTQLCPTLWDPVNCSPPGSSVHGILQAGMLEWVAMPFQGVSQPQDQTRVSCFVVRLLLSEPLRGWGCIILSKGGPCREGHWICKNGLLEHPYNVSFQILLLYLQWWEALYLLRQAVSSRKTSDS